MTQFARIDEPFGFCDYCNFRYPLRDLKTEVVNLKPVGNRVCPECWSPDQPQLHIGLINANDPMTLRDPRPDPALAISRGLYGWNPVWNPAEDIQMSIGYVTVETN